jgi:hypothetical protein
VARTVRVMRRFLLIGLAVVVVGVLGVAAVTELTKTAPAGWSDPEAHVVDGLWFGAETVCPLEGGQACSLPLDAALERVAVIEPGATVITASVAKPVGGYRDGRGGTTLATTSGGTAYRIALITLADGRRLMVGVHCDPQIESGVGTTPARCRADTEEIHAPRAGEEPWLEPD